MNFQETSKGTSPLGDISGFGWIPGVNYLVLLFGTVRQMDQ